jgi:hypothetical protein
MAMLRSIPRRVWPPLGVAVVTLLVGVAGYLRAEAPPAAGCFYLRSAGGAVLFQHDDHQHRGIACERCHHEASSGRAAATEARNCRGCHRGEGGEAGEAGEADAGGQAVRSVADVYHSGCNECHLTMARARFADASGKLLCHACHLK